MSEQEVYQKFIDWVGGSWWKMTESEHLMPMIQAYVTPAEAEFLTGIPMSGKSLEDLAELKGMNLGEIGPEIKRLAEKGLIFVSINEDSRRYRLSDSFFTYLRAAFWPGRVTPEVEAVAPHVNKYFKDGWFDQFADAHLKGLRAIPINKTIDDTRGIMPFEDIIQVIEDREYYSVSACPCRMRHNVDHDTEDCGHPLEVCLHFDRLGRYAVENGQGREITKEETFEILKKAADAGLVHGISNWKDKPDTICNCCNDACMWFEAQLKLGHGKSLDASNYTVTAAPEKCRACGLCIKRCPMDALQLKYFNQARNKFYKAVQVDEDLCIGCGVCAHKCPSHALTLKRNGEITEPPASEREFGFRYMTDRQAALAANKE